jgi:hypothetical protein
MKHLKSSSQNLRELFEQNISVRHIAEPLTSFDHELPASTVFSFMKQHEYDVVGVRRDGLVIGYVDQAPHAAGDSLSKLVIPFSPINLVDDTTPLLDALSLMRQSPRLFVRVLGQVGGIVTHGDLQKAPVRMWLFGLISLVEMQLLRLIREAYPDDAWEQLIMPTRLRQAKRVLADRQQRNAAIDLADCLQLCDKREIILGSEVLLDVVGFADKEQGKTLLTELEQLRNNLAHAQDIVTGYWPKIVDIADQAESLLRRCEEKAVRPIKAA